MSAPTTAPVNAAAGPRPWRPPLFVFQKIRVQGDGRFLTDHDGKAAVVAPVLDRYSDLVDLVAFDPVAPCEWFMRHGDMCPILGARLLAYEAEMGREVKMFPTPSDWLFAHGDGVCVLDWDVRLLPLFSGLGKARVDHLEASVAKELKERLKHNFWRDQPKIISPGGRASYVAR